MPLTTWAAGETGVTRLAVTAGLKDNVTLIRVWWRVIRRGANSANCLVNSPGGQPGTNKSSATLVKSRSLNGK